MGATRRKSPQKRKHRKKQPVSTSRGYKLLNARRHPLSPTSLASTTAANRAKAHFSFGVTRMQQSKGLPLSQMSETQMAKVWQKVLSKEEILGALYHSLFPPKQAQIVPTKLDVKSPAEEMSKVVNGSSRPPKT